MLLGDGYLNVLDVARCRRDEIVTFKKILTHPITDIDRYEMSLT